MNETWLRIDPLFHAWVVIILTVLVFIFVAWREIKRNHRFLIFRIAAQILVMVSLLGLFLRPALSEKRKIPRIMLLTRGFDKSKADSVVKADPVIKIFRMPEAEAYPLSEPFSGEFNTEGSGEIRIVLGEGLPAHVLELLDRKNFKFMPGNNPAGFTQLIIPKVVHPNQINSIRGTFNSKQNMTLKLISPSGVEDSVHVNRGPNFFELSFKSKQPGLFIYDLVSDDEADNVKIEKVPIEVSEERKLRILFLQKFPTAEVRYLKNYLTKAGHSLGLRYQVSKNNFRYEYANLPAMRLDKVTPELAKAFDLVFIDSNVLSELGEIEKNVLSQSLQAGLGAIILLNDAPASGKTVYESLAVGTSRKPNDTIHIQFQESKHYILPALPVEIVSDYSIHAVTKHRDRVLSGYVYKGAGKVAFQLLRETYRIGLEGNNEGYASLWSSLIEQAARSENKMFNVKLISSFPFYENEPLSIEVISTGPQPALVADRILLPLTEDVMLDDVWYGKTWAGKSGWHQLSVTQDSTQLNYYVSEKEEWRSLNLANQMQLNINVQEEDGSEGDKIEYERKSISPLLFFFVFLLASGFLWLAPKL